MNDPYPIVRVELVDLKSDLGWMSDERLKSLQPYNAVAVGHLVEDAKGHIKLANMVGSVGDDEAIGDVLTIPRGCVVSIRVLYGAPPTSWLGDWWRWR